MPINRYLKEGDRSAEEVARLTSAFNLALNSLNLVDRSDPLSDMVARKIIEVGRDGLKEPREIADLAVKEIGLWSFSTRSRAALCQ
jgi:hypothetical protein